jgi:hypothetical protein
MCRRLFFKRPGVIAVTKPNPARRTYTNWLVIPLPAQERDVSDILGCLPDGRFLAIEVKSDNGHATDEQAAFIADVIRHGGVAFVARSMDDVEQRELAVVVH